MTPQREVGKETPSLRQVSDVGPRRDSDPQTYFNTDPVI